MPNYIITTKANFKPFSYAELLAPVASATKAHRELEDAYSELDTKASVWERLANSPQDKDVYDIYKNYSNDLNQAADSLAKEGLTPTSRRELSKLKARYSSDITPIEDAYNRREQDRTNYKQALMKDPTLLSGSNPTTASLSDYMGGKQPIYHNVSGNDLYKRGAAASKASSLRRYSGTNIGHALGAQYWKLTKSQGYSPTEAALFLADTNNIPELEEAINRISNEYNVNALEDKERAVDYIISGIMDGMVYKEEDDYKKDDNFISAYQREVLNNARNKGNNDISVPEYSYRLDSRISDTQRNSNINIASKILNYNQKDFDSLFDSSGKIKEVEIKRDSIYGMPLHDVTEENKINELNKVLKDSGYNPEKMSKNEIIEALNTISSGNTTGISNNWLRIDLSSEASKDIKERTSNKSYYTIENFNKDGSVKGKRKPLEISDKESSKLFIDIESGTPGIYMETSSGIYDVTSELSAIEKQYLFNISNSIKNNNKLLQSKENELLSLLDKEGNIIDNTTNGIFNFNALREEYMIIKYSIQNEYQKAHDLVKSTLLKHHSTQNVNKNE